MNNWDRWLLPGIFAAVGVSFLIAGGVLWAVVPGKVANHAKEVARLPVATAATLNERGAPVLLEGKVSDRNSPSDRPPLVAYDEYHRVYRDDEWEWDYVRSYNPTLWVQIPGKEVEIAAGYTLRSTVSQVEEGSDRSYEGFKVNDPVLVLGTLSIAGDSRSVEPTASQKREPTRNHPVVDKAEIGFETKAAYLLSLEQDQATARWLGLVFSGLGSLLTLIAALVVYLNLREIGRDR
ncbi:hypothetical protein [Phormidium tenue]|uniref:Uncharacterized protein n=1 Tax=Phormidium tenue NIES-30 TaxID=549789 RepID=A0A1U7J3Y0_9CYAN|nr:hypothetical protein [Phormidium tenue]MBD2233015.1 hypothetical protein [Phormidium tenue FACHB-1052]OKH47164.1 hypothetical protein NIES30_14420 [Phormidium tenue NIES-30]